MNTNHIHLIKYKDFNLLFHYPTYSVIEVSDSAYSILQCLQLGENTFSIAQKHHCNSKDIDIFIDKLESRFNEGKNTLIDCQNNEDNQREIERITLHISNDCNLRCKYCYANGGDYNMKREMMSKDTAEKFVDFCCKNFERIGHIVFFGGEPLMNVPIMKFVCEKFVEYKEKGKIKNTPYFGIITNGTIVNDEIISFLKEKISFITVSIDGPKELNDHNRVFANGKGSFNRIKHFIKRVTDETDITLQYEATYTDFHLKKGIKNKDLINFFKEEFNIRGTVTDELNISSDVKHKYENQLDLNSFSEDSFANLPDGFWGVISAVVNKEPKQMCQIYRKTFAISTKGDIYPCHMNTGESSLELGNIVTNNIFNQSENYKNSFPLLFKIQNKEKVCGNCWAQNICGGCTRKWFYDEQSKIYTEKPNEKLCESNKRYMEELLILIASIRKNPKVWNMFLQKAKPKI